MRRILIYTSIATAVVCAAAFLFWSTAYAPSQKTDITEVHIGGKTVSVDVADTPEERALGLGGRTGLREDEGLLFIFTESDFHSFWMADMLFSIDIIWISEEGTVVDIAASVSPDSYPSSFSPTAPARYVLEVPAGFAEEYTVQKGDRVRFD